MKTTPLPSPLPSPKAGVLSTSSASGKAGHRPRAHHEAGAGSALGFLAELAAAIGAVGPLGQPLPAPTQQSGKPGTPAGTSGISLATAPAAISQPHVTERHGAATADVQTRAVITSTGIAPASTDSAPLSPAGTPLAQAAVTTAMPVEVTASTPQPPAPHHTKPAATTASADASSTTQVTPSAPAAADPALTTSSAAAGIDPLPAAAASTPAAVTTDDGTGQATAVLRQVFPEVTRVAATPGTHRLAITLHPEDLGEVRVTVVVRGDNVRVSVATDPTSGTARTALQHGAPELRQLLKSTGANAHVEFRDLAPTGAGLGSATDGGSRQQSQAFAQAHSHAQSEAQAHAQGDGQHHRQPRTQPDPPLPHRPSLTTAPDAQSGTRLPTVRTATAGLDRLI